MVLIIAIVAGLSVGVLQTRLRKQPYQLPDLALLWLGVVAFIPQWLAIYLPATRKIIPDAWASIALIASQLMLLVFVWANRRRRGFWILGLGLALNLAAILLNRGWMPISPKMVTRLFPNASPGAWEIGMRLGKGKDIVLNLPDMHCGFLGDQIYIPFPFPLHPTAFSLGDFLIAAGAAGFLALPGSSKISPAAALNLSVSQPQHQ